MKPRIRVAEARTPEGGNLSLIEHDGAWSINFDGNELMHSRACESERLLGELGGKPLKRAESPRVLVGGLGLGITLQSALSYLPRKATVDVVELLPEVVEWARTHLKELNGNAMADARVRVIVDDVAQVIRKAPASHYDAVILDVDNGPRALVQTGNAALYSNNGLRRLSRALVPGGTAVCWSAGADRAFEEKLKRGGFHVRAVPAKTHEGARRAAYMLYVARASGSEAQ